MHRRFALAVVVAVGLSSAACAQESELGTGTAVETTADARDARTMLRAAPDLAQQAGTSRFEMVMHVEAPGEGAFSLTMEGGIDTDRQLAHMVIDMGDLAEAAGEEAADFFGDGSMEMIFTADSVYLRGGFFGDRWLAGSSEDLGEEDLADVFGTSSGPPVEGYLELLRGVGADPVEVGREEVRGVATTRYSASFTFGEALAAASPEERAQLEEQLDLDEFPLDAEIPVEVWIDDDGLPRRMTLALDEAMEGLTEEGITASFTFELFDYGEPLDIVVPDDDDVAPLGEAFGGFFGG
ncbi:MAG: hypothetical protein AB7L84_11785 [Acidimicrobiia bacterium]